MKTIVKKLYEAMFLVDSAESAADWDGVIATIQNILERADAEVVSIAKWDERRLAYDIRGRSRGTYILCYFRAEGGKIRGIERDVQLSERIMRVLILCAEHMKPEDIERDAPLTLAEKAGQESTAVTSEEAKTEGPEKQSKAEEDSEAQDKASAVSDQTPGEPEGFDESVEVTKGGTADAATAEPQSADLAVTQQQEQVETKSEPGSGEGIEEAEDEESHE